MQISLPLLKTLRRHFDLVSSQGKDGLTMDEFLEACKEFVESGKFTEFSLRQLFMKVDANADGECQWHEFCDFILLENQRGSSALKGKDGDGYVPYNRDDDRCPERNFCAICQVYDPNEVSIYP